MAKSKQVVFLASEEERKRYQDAAYERRISMGELIRTAIRHELDNYPTKAESER